MRSKKWALLCVASALSVSGIAQAQVPAPPPGYELVQEGKTDTASSDPIGRTRIPAPSPTVMQQARQILEQHVVSAPNRQKVLSVFRTAGTVAAFKTGLDQVRIGNDVKTELWDARIGTLHINAPSPFRAPGEVDAAVNCEQLVSDRFTVLLTLQRRREEIDRSGSSPLDKGAAHRVVDDDAAKQATFDDLRQWRAEARNCLLTMTKSVPVTKINMVYMATRVMELTADESSRRVVANWLTFNESQRQESAQERDQAAGEYSKLIDKYNGLVRDYNSLVDRTNQFMAQDRKFHALVSTYLSQPVVAPTFPTIPPPQRRIYCSTNSWGASAFTNCYEQ